MGTSSGILEASSKREEILGEQRGGVVGTSCGHLGTSLGVLGASWGRPGSTWAVHLQTFSRNIELHWQRNRTNISMLLIEDEGLPMMVTKIDINNYLIIQTHRADP